MYFKNNEAAPTLSIYSTTLLIYLETAINWSQWELNVPGVLSPLMLGTFLQMIKDQVTQITLMQMEGGGQISSTAPKTSRKL